MTDDNRSNIARAHDASFERYQTACKLAEAAADTLREGVQAGRYSEQAAGAVQQALARFDSDPDFFLINVPNALSAPLEVLATDYGQHGVDGHYLPRSEGIALANAVGQRNAARKDIRDNWQKMTSVERAERVCP